MKQHLTNEQGRVSLVLFRNNSRGNSGSKSERGIAVMHLCLGDVVEGSFLFLFFLWDLVLGGFFNLFF